MASPPAGCGRCSAPSPSAKEVLENRGLFPCSISRKKEKKRNLCVFLCQSLQFTVIIAKPHVTAAEVLMYTRTEI